MYHKCVSCRNCVEVTHSGMVLNGRELQAFCFYCVTDAFKTGARKIGHKASWTGSTPKWCPVEQARAEVGA